MQVQSVKCFQFKFQCVVQFSLCRLSKLTVFSLSISVLYCIDSLNRMESWWPGRSWLLVGQSCGFRRHLCAFFTCVLDITAYQVLIAVIICSSVGGEMTIQPFLLFFSCVCLYFLARKVLLKLMQSPHCYFVSSMCIQYDYECFIFEQVILVALQGCVYVPSFVLFFLGVFMRESSMFYFSSVQTHSNLSVWPWAVEIFSHSDSQVKWSFLPPRTLPLLC